MFGLGKKDEEEVEIKEVKVEGVTYSEGASPTTEAPSSAVTTESAFVADSSKVESDEPAPLTWKEAKALKRSKYASTVAENDKFTKNYVIRNKQTNQVVELRAASSIHACNLIGWKPRKVEVLATHPAKAKAEAKEPETVASSTPNE
jgi:hypothetical protein